MKRPTMLYQALLTQVSIELDVPTERDYAYLRSRCEHEGLSFLTITLPTLSDALERGLESGCFTTPLGFKRVGTLPAFLQGLFKRVFALDGSLLQYPCGYSIKWIRQVCRFFKKPKIKCSEARESAAIRNYIAVEEDLRRATSSVKRQDIILDQVARILWSQVLPVLDGSSLICGHGPGVTADRRLPNERRRITKWYTRFEDSFGVADHAFHNYGSACNSEGKGGLSSIDFLDLRDEPAVRVVFVPKTLQSPRVIAIEPHCMQFVQQGLLRWLIPHLETHPLTAGSVNFTNQSVNQSLAYSASIDRSLATIDLKDASDRVHFELVRRIFKGHSILEFLEDARSLHADLPNGQNVILTKYASMGSALCFPVEAMVFYTLILSSIHQSLGIRPTNRSIMRLKKHIFVYGDDIIIPVQYVGSVSSYLESYALRVNSHKSFSKSAFRESCGADYFNGVDVKPIYARELAPDRREEWTPSHIMSWVSTANQFYMTGSWVIAQAIRDMVSSMLKHHIPISTFADSGIVFASYFQNRNLVYDKNLHNWRQRRLQYIPLKQKDSIDGDEHASYNLCFSKQKPTTLGNYRREDSSSPFVPGRWRASQAYPRSRKHLDYATDCSTRRPQDHGHRFVTPRGPDTRQSVGLLLERLGQSPGVGECGETRLSDFHQTVKRGSFKSKSRWTILF